MQADLCPLVSRPKTFLLVAALFSVAMEKPQGGIEKHENPWTSILGMLSLIERLCIWQKIILALNKSWTGKESKMAWSWAGSLQVPSPSLHSSPNLASFNVYYPITDSLCRNKDSYSWGNYHLYFKYLDSM